MLPILPTKGIYYIGQYGTSGYASAARGYLYHYFTLGVPITWDPLYFDDSELSDDDPYNIVIKSFINKRLSYHDTVIMHSTPDLWPRFRREKQAALNNKIIIGYCTWETNKLSPDWVNCINQSVNEVWVPSKYNQETFLNSGVERTIRVVPHIFLYKPLPNRENIKLTDNSNGNVLANDKYTFYSIGELNSRKNIMGLLDAFCTTFSSADNVRLILKVHYKDYTELNKLKCKNMIMEKLMSFSNCPEVICLFDSMTSDQILSIHSIGDCYITLTKSEGFGLTIHDAFNYGKKIIVTGYGGQLDFLGINHPGLVGYKIGEVDGMESKNYGSDQVWAHPDLDHAKQLMKEMYDRNFRI